MSDLLLEIGCENLPPASIKPAFEQLARLTAGRLAEHRLPYEEIYTTGSPRRLVLIVRGLAATQTSQTETVTGPPASRAFDGNGNPTQAAVGFARSQGVAVKDLECIPTERGEYMGVTRRLRSQRASVLLREILPGLIVDLKFPKVMHWESTGASFARPIRWLVALLGEKIVRFKVAGITAGNVTHTIPWIRRDRIKVRGADHYLSRLSKAGVVLDHEERFRKIERQAQQAAARAGLTLVEDRALCGELTFMLEDPRHLVGAFDEKYLKLPPEVVITAMKAHQRYLALRGKRKRLVAKFITFTEGKVGSPAEVRRGNEKVLKARLEDALFYWREDVKTGIEGLADKLRSIVFVEGLGTLADKAARLETIGLHLAKSGALELPGATIARAARLAKADLASEMIKDGKEFTLLQGMIGSHYAGEAGESGETVTALREYYMPRNPTDPLPATTLGALLGVADRIDTITGCFLAGLTPSGSQDPYALRRLANGLIRILEDRPEVSIQLLLDATIAAFEEQGLTGQANGEARERLAEFFQNRTEAFLKERGIAYDVVGAVSAVAWALPALALKRARAMETARGNDAFELLITGAKRVGNILEKPHKILGADWPRLQTAFLESGALSEELRFDPGRFEDEAEETLYAEIKKAVPRMIESDSRADADSVFNILAGLGPTIDRYFDRVLVNCPDRDTRDNRHRFLATVFALFSKYADFSYIVEEGTPPSG
jgi:glycyl-tRNA synthetase beta chain